MTILDSSLGFTITVSSPICIAMFSSQAIQFSQSPSDSRVPRTPSVARSISTQNESLDQNVPLTPNRQRGLYSSVPVVFSTPTTSSTLSGFNSSHQQRDHESLPSQGTSPSNMPHSSDQRVPSTPSNLQKPSCRADVSPLTVTEQPLSSSPMSLVPNSRTPRTNHFVSPVQASLPEASTSTWYRLHSILQIENAHDDERSLTGKSEPNQSQESAKRTLSSSSTGGKIVSTNQIALSSTEQREPNEPAKCTPPFRRCLFLGQRRQKDALRRAAHHNLACQKSMTEAICKGNGTNSNCSSTVSQSIDQAVALDELIPSDDAYNLCGSSHAFDSSFSATSTAPSPQIQLNSENFHLLSPAGDASNTPVNKKRELVSNNRNKLRAVIDMDNSQCKSTPTTFSKDDLRKGTKRKQSTLLDLFDDSDDEIFG